MRKVIAFRRFAVSFSVVMGAAVVAMAAPPSPSAPVVQSFAPHDGPSGTVVTLFGRNLATVKQVHVGKRSVPFQTMWNTLRVTIPADTPPGPVTLTVDNPAGESTLPNSQSFDVVAPPPAPKVTAMAPTHGASGARVTFTGTSLQAVTQVYFNGTSVQFHRVDNHLESAIPPNAKVGVGHFTFEAKGERIDPGSLTSFTVVAPPPPPPPPPPAPVAPPYDSASLCTSLAGDIAAHYYSYGQTNGTDLKDKCHVTFPVGWSTCPADDYYEPYVPGDALPCVKKSNQYMKFNCYDMCPAGLTAPYATTGIGWNQKAATPWSDIAVQCPGVVANTQNLSNASTYKAACPNLHCSADGMGTNKSCLFSWNSAANECDVKCYAGCPSGSTMVSTPNGIMCQPNARDMPCSPVHFTAYWGNNQTANLTAPGSYDPKTGSCSATIAYSSLPAGLLKSFTH